MTLSVSHTFQPKQTIRSAQVNTNTNEIVSYVNSLETTLNAAITSAVNSLIPSGTAMIFYQAAAPTGWTKSTAQNDKALRVVSGTGGGTGGTNAFSSGLAHTHTTGNFTLTTAEMPAHTHTQIVSGGDGVGANYYSDYVVEDTGDGIHGIVSAETTGSTGGGGAHNHGNTGSTSPTFQYIDVIVCTKN